MSQSQQRKMGAIPVTYTTAPGNSGSLTYWAKPGIKPASSGILVGFITPEPQWEFQAHTFKSQEIPHKLLGLEFLWGQKKVLGRADLHAPYLELELWAGAPLNHTPTLPSWPCSYHSHLLNFLYVCDLSSLYRPFGYAVIVLTISNLKNQLFRGKENLLKKKKK